LTQREKDWQVDVYGVDGAIKRVCTLAGGRIDCPEK
jgi:hypothetical protein